MNFASSGYKTKMRGENFRRAFESDCFVLPASSPLCRSCCPGSRNRLLPRFRRGQLLRFRRRLAVAHFPVRQMIRQAQLLTQFMFDLAANVGMFLQELPRIVTALAQTIRLVGNPCAGFLKQAAGYSQVEQVAFLRNAFTVNDVEFGFAEWRGNFVLHDLRASP